MLLHAALHRALEAALRLGLVVRNVSDRADVPRKRHREMSVLSPEQVHTFFGSIAGNRYEALYILALTTGMRQGELLGLKWSEVDLDDASLQVRASLQKVRGTFILAEPKTARSRRKVALTALAVEALRRHHANQVAQCLALGPAWQDRDLVFTNRIGNPVDRIDLMRREFLPLLQAAGLPPMRFHDLRHSAATLLLRQGVHPKVVAEMLGHSQISMTLDTYSHVLPDMQRDATVALDRLLGRNRG
jgi:integrase